ncbi:Hypothetical predicted protein [Scomber scombrus]|uniref:Uncharacterized protein n=1 Tax=Scomber scombrus TaxID=13677 RepID=A0AAV1N2N1_SCOSC
MTAAEFRLFLIRLLFWFCEVAGGLCCCKNGHNGTNRAHLQCLQLKTSYHD